MKNNDIELHTKIDIEANLPDGSFLYRFHGHIRIDQALVTGIPEEEKALLTRAKKTPQEVLLALAALFKRAQDLHRVKYTNEDT